MSNLKAVLFDMDGTLIDTAPTVGIAMSAMFRDLHGIEIDPAACRKYVGPPMQWSFADAGVPADRIEESMQDYRRRYSEIMFDSPPFAGMIEAIQLAKGLGLGTAVATSKQEIAARNIVEHWNFGGVLDYVSGADASEKNSDKALVVDAAVVALEQTGHLDPSLRVIPYVDEPQGPRRDDIFLVGDRFYDIEGAAKANINTVLVGWGTSQPGEGADAWKRVEQVEELHALIRELAG